MAKLRMDYIRGCPHEFYSSSKVETLKFILERSESEIGASYFGLILSNPTIVENIS